MTIKQNDSKYCWDLTRIYKDDNLFYSECDAILLEVPKLEAFKGNLKHSKSLLNYLEEYHRVLVKLDRVFDYAYLTQALDNRAARGQTLIDRAHSVEKEFSSATSFTFAELTTIPSAELAKLLSQEPELKTYTRYIEKFEEYRPHVRSAEVALITAQTNRITRAPSDVYNMLTNADMPFSPALDGKGKSHPVSQGDVDGYLQSNDRTLRENAFNSYADGYYQFRNTIASAYRGNCSANYFNSIDIAKFRSVLEEVAFWNDVNEEVFHTTIDTCQELQPVWQRYFKVKAKLLGLPKIAEFDIHAPLSSQAPQVSYEEACELTLNAITPLGAEYASKAREGLYNLRWVDVYPKPGKSSNAFSAGSYTTDPKILMNFCNTIPDVGTLAHELGHSMHSLYTKTTQPRVNASYSMIIAETASNFNQSLLRHEMLKSSDREWKLATLDETFSNFHRYTFMFPILSRLEYETHTNIQTQKAVTADWLCSRCTELFSSAYGDSVTIDPKRVSMRWAQFGHVYAPYYLHTYAIGISAAAVLAGKIAAGDTYLRDRYLHMLSQGAAQSVLDLYASVDIDPCSPNLIREAFKSLTSYIDILESLI